MANAILDKFSSNTAITITLGSLASSDTVGRQGTIVDNTSDRYSIIKLWASIKLGTSPASNKGVTLWLIQSDGTRYTDGAGGSDAAFTVINAKCIGTLSKASPSTGDVLSDWFTIVNPGKQWTVAVTQNSGANLNATDGNHVIQYYGVYPEVQ